MQKHCLNQRRKLLLRKQSGAALVESVSGLVVLIPLVTATLLLMVSVGLFVIYKIKVGFIANQAAQYASGLCSWESSYIQYPNSWGNATAESLVNDVVYLMCEDAGLPVPKKGKHFATLTDKGGTRIQVNVNVTGFIQPFSGKTPVTLPISISDLASYDVTADQPSCILELHPQNGANQTNYSTAIPCYGVFTPGSAPSWNSVKGKALSPPYTAGFAFSGNWVN